MYLWLLYLAYIVFGRQLSAVYLAELPQYLLPGKVYCCELSLIAGGSPYLEGSLLPAGLEHL